MFFDPSTNTLNIALGAAYNTAEPTAIFANNNSADATDVANNDSEVKVKTKTAAGKTKSKTRLVFYTATKAEINNSTSTNAAK